VNFRFAGPDPVDGPPIDLPLEGDLVSARLDQSGSKVCSNPSDRTTHGPFDVRIADTPTPSVASLWSGGALAGDLDADGILDLVEPAEPFARLFRGRADGRFTSWDERLADFDLTYGTGGSLADFDGDEDLDALVLRYDAPAVLLRNEGLGTFTDVTEAAGLTAAGSATSSTWADSDGDGDLDLFVGAYEEIVAGDGVEGKSYLYENVDGILEDRSDTLPPEVHAGFTRVAGFHDIDGDQRPELYIVNDVGSVTPNVLLANEAGRLVPDASRGLDLQMSGGGLGVGDVNGDLRPDFLVPQWDVISLMLSNADGRWYDNAAARGLVTDPLRDQRVGWGAELADIDNDGDLDGIVAYGWFEVPDPLWDNPTLQPDALFVQQEDGTFVDEAPAWGVDDLGTGRGFVVADLDDDGWLDLVKRDLAGPTRSYVSHCGRNHYLKVELRQPDSMNRFAVGAVVRVVLGDGRILVRWVNAGGTGFGTGGPPELHFGLGSEMSIDRLEVVWPDGALSWVGFGADADQTVTVTREE
jgi:enediyne biosynthesis protein E4